MFPAYERPVDFERVGALQPLQRIIFFVPTQLSIHFQLQSKVIDLVDPSLFSI
jgi:hypothetical protein